MRWVEFTVDDIGTDDLNYYDNLPDAIQAVTGRMQEWQETCGLPKVDVVWRQAPNASLIASTLGYESEHDTTLRVIESGIRFELDA